jgi:hypothetical protein
MGFNSGLKGLMLALNLLNWSTKLGETEVVMTAVNT